MAHLFINHYDISEFDDFKLLGHFVKSVGIGKVEVEALDYKDLELINFKLFNPIPPDICEDDIEFRNENTGPKRIIDVKDEDHILYVEFLYKKVK